MLPLLAVKELLEIIHPPINPSLAAILPVNSPWLAYILPLESTIKLPSPRAMPLIPTYTFLFVEIEEGYWVGKSFNPEYNFPASITKPFSPPI